MSGAKEARVVLDILGSRNSGTFVMPISQLRAIAQAAVDAEPRVIATAEEAGQLPTGSVIVDDSGAGPAWVIEEDSVTDTWHPAFEGRKVRGVAGFGGVGYSVVYPAILIHTPKEPTP
jgi:hypothetical protein